MTLYDLLMVKATIEIVYNKSYQCGFCVKRVAETVREMTKNCTGKAKVFRGRELDVFKFSVCPGNFYNPAYAQLLDTHRQFRKGVLATKGGLLDQSSKYIDLMNLVESVVSEKELEQLKKSTKDGVRKSS